MDSKIIKARVKMLLLTLLVTGFIYVTTTLLNMNMIYQITLFIILTIYYTVKDRAQLKIFIGFTRFLLIMIVLLHIIFFVYKVLSMGYDFAKSFYIERWDSIVIRVFIIPNIFAFVNILISRVNFIDLLLVTRNGIKGKTIYILIISGVDVMERLRVYYEYHPSNITNSNREKLIHYLAIPLTLFFGIQKGFEQRYNTLMEREKIIMSLDKQE